MKVLSCNIYVKSMMKTRKMLISLNSLSLQISLPFIKTENQLDKVNSRTISILSILPETFTKCWQHHGVNAGKYGPEKLRMLFTKCILSKQQIYFRKGYSSQYLLI